MQEELNQFERNQFWYLIPKPYDRPTLVLNGSLGISWMSRVCVVRNKPRLLAQGYTQIKGIDFEKTFAPVAQLEAIWMTLAFDSYKDFKLFQMDIKSVFK